MRSDNEKRTRHRAKGGETMKIVIDHDNDQIRFGPDTCDDDNLTSLPKPRTMREVEHLFEEVLAAIYAEDARHVSLDRQDDGRLHSLEDWALEDRTS